MPSCAWSEKKKTCGLLTQSGSIYCPRHTFLHNITQQAEVAKSEAKKQRQDSAPKTRAELLSQGYKHVNNAECHGCHRPIEWWTTPNDRRAPYDPMPEFDSPAVSHFATCKRANDFRRAG